MPTTTTTPEDCDRVGQQLADALAALEQTVKGAAAAGIPETEIARRTRVSRPRVRRILGKQG